MGEFLGAIAGALITGLFGLWLLKKQDDSKIDSLLEGADRKNRKDISNNEIAFNKAAQGENAEINRKLNELIAEQNKINSENNKISQSIEILKVQQNDKWEQKKIDADIKAKARIDWIQEVRKRTVDFLEVIDMPNKIEKQIQLKQFSEINKKARLLKLYFSNDSIKELISNKNYDDYLNKLTNLKSNADKNGEIWMMINYLTKEYRDLNMFDLYGNYIDAELTSENDFYLIKSYATGDDGRYDECFSDIELIEQLLIDFPEDPVLIRSVQEYREKLETMKEIEKDLEIYEEKLDDFQRIISIYLKIEWNIAKEGK